jgi:hypothetical protein
MLDLDKEAFLRAQREKLEKNIDKQYKANMGNFKF